MPSQGVLSKEVTLKELKPHIISVDNIDTDQIYPSRYLGVLNRSLYKTFCFQDVRYQYQLETFADINCLIVGENFGSGSSREHAVWAFLDNGVDTIIAKSFARIFYDNAILNGMTLIQLDLSRYSSISLLTLDPEAKTITLDGDVIPIELNKFSKVVAASGGDCLDYLLSKRRIVQNFLKKCEVPNV